MQNTQSNQLKSKRFLAWRVARVQEAQKAAKVHKILFARERLRAESVH